MTRRRIVITLSVVASVVVLAMIAASAVSVWSVRRAFPDYDDDAVIPRLSGEVEVVRDQHGIPHIYAGTPEDLFRAQAYVHAQDRFWQMDVRRHITAGRLAELFGPDQVDTDVFVRTLGWRSTAREELPQIRPRTRRYLDAYADGVNAWMAGHTGGERGIAYTLLGLTGADDDPDEWTPVDSLSWLKAMAWDLRSNVEDEIARGLLSADLPTDRVEQLYPEPDPDVSEPIVDDEDIDATLPESIVGPEGRPVPIASISALQAAAAQMDAAPVTLGSGAGIGSNSWVVGGELTASSTPLLANDPHLAPTMPSTWYQVGLHCREVGPECPYDVVGYSFAGLPGVVIGHNQSIAWGFTNLAPDVTDLYLEQIRDDDTYLWRGRWLPMDTREETIAVAGGDPVTVTVRSTRHGPVVSDHDDRLADVGDTVRVPGQDHPDSGYAVALRWTALDPGRTADALFALNRATDWRSFRAAASRFEVPSQNLVYADVNGNIGYQAPGKIPVRRNGDGRYPVPGWTGEHDWAGYIPFDDLPRVRNPEDGFIVTANQPVTSGRYPFLLTADFDAGHRAGRIQDLLADAVEAGTPIDAALMADIQMDTHSAAADVLLPYLREFDPPPGYYGDGLRLLDGWNGAMARDSAAAAYFNAVWRNVLELTFHDELPERLWPRGEGRWFEVVRDLLERPHDPYWDDVDTADIVEDRDSVLISAIRDARDDVTARQGKDASEWEWGRLHGLTLTEQTFGTSGIGPVEWLFNKGPYAVGGGTSIVQATGWNAAEGYETMWAPSMRMLVDLGDLDASRWIDLTGISGHPFHENYGDQVERWRTGQTLPMRWSEQAVREAGEHTMTLAPPDTASTP